MKNLSTVKQYLISAIIQIILITVFIVSVALLLRIEKVVMNPLPYLIPVGAVVVVIDIVFLMFIYRKNRES
ncbi:MAG TPA: hypothetical protein GXX36_03085 [Clostridiaceae bacterium]|nr:hypothetical protein [Clostridiaceae bacterium]